MQKKSKNFQFLKKFFFARNNLKCLKICSQHHLCSPQQISGRYLSKKKLVIFQEICDPGYAKKVKKFPFLKKIFFARNNLKCLKICSQHHLCRTGSWSFFKKSVTPDMQKKSKNFQFLKKIFFARNNLKCLKICSQHHLCTTNFRPVFLKKVVSHFLRNLWPRTCKKSQKIFFRSKQP